jgi:hypothetical protein
MAESDLGKSEVFWTLFVVQAAWEAWPRRQSRWRGEGAPGGALKYTLTYTVLSSIDLTSLHQALQQRAQPNRAPRTSLSSPVATSRRLQLLLLVVVMM